MGVRRLADDLMTGRAAWNGTVLAESDDTILVEGNQYFPTEDVMMELLEKSESSTHGPLLGITQSLTTPPRASRIT
jgi:uncharacterized protein (DUF427 family)